MRSHPISRFRAGTERQAEFVHRGETFAFASAKVLGDDVLAIVFPDAAEALRECKHAALVNGRVRPYPADAYASAVAIWRTLVVGEGVEPPDLTTLLAVYDGDPELFQRCTEAALSVLGLIQEDAGPGGLASWELVVGHLHAGSVERALAVALGAVRALRPGFEEPVAGEDPLLDSALGN